VTEVPLLAERLPPPEIIDQVKGLFPPIPVKTCCPPQLICFDVNPMAGGGQPSQEAQSAQTGELKNIVAIRQIIIKKASTHEDLLLSFRGITIGTTPFRNMIYELLKYLFGLCFKEKLY